MKSSLRKTHETDDEVSVDGGAVESLTALPILKRDTSVSVPERAVTTPQAAD